METKQPRGHAREGAREARASPARTSTGGATTPAPQPAGNGKLNVGASGGWCNVTVDGAARGATPVAGLELSAGSHRVTCTTADGKAQSATVNVPVDGTARYKFTLVAGGASLAPASEGSGTLTLRVSRARRDARRLAPA